MRKKKDVLFEERKRRVSRLSRDEKTSRRIQSWYTATEGKSPEIFLGVKEAEMDPMDEKILTRIEREFPVSPYPYRDLAKDLGLCEEEVISRISQLKRKGVILRIGAFFDSEKLGFKSTLVAMKVPQRRLQEVAKIVNRYSGVTHNYGRDHEFNLWFVLMGKSKKEVDEALKKIKKQTRIAQILKLPKRKLFKLNVNFTRKENNL
ncbi:MAG: Lrp/AsnC family transcriptional regulator [bacterium]